MARTTRRVEARGIGVGKKLAHVEDIMNLHVGREFKGTRGGRGSLNDLEGADEPWHELGGWVDVLEVEVMGREANNVTNRVHGDDACSRSAIDGLEHGRWRN